MEKDRKGCLFLLPSPISEDKLTSIPQESLSMISSIKHIICERARSSRRAIKALLPDTNISELNIIEGGHHFDKITIQQGILWLNEGFDVGLMSEAGSPAIADPGAEFVLTAQKQNIKVVPLVGPNSIFMALMASGLGGQYFCFHGYLPNKKEALISKLKSLANNKSLHSYTHICIETPYRNVFLFEHLKTALSKNTYVCIASGIQSNNERILTKKLSEWDIQEIKIIHKVPSIFLFKFSR